MLDLKAIRRHPDAVRAALARRKDGSDERLDEALALDARRREPLREVGEPRGPNEPRDHLELADGLIDMERAARVSGSRFAYLKGDMVLLELALVRWGMDVL